MPSRSNQFVQILLALLFSVTLAFGEIINLNTATLEELDALPHVGKYTAERIIEMRPITDLNALLAIKGMDRKEVAALEKLVTLGEKPGEPSFAISVGGVQVPVTRIGTGPVGVIVFAHSGAREMIKYIQKNCAWLGDIPERCSLFLWEYPSIPPFDQVQPTIQSYQKDKTTKLLLPGLASNVITQIRQKSGLKEFLIVGNSLGAGIVLQDYAALVGDKALTFLLISPTESFMPPAETIPPLERTVILAAKGWGEGSSIVRADPFLRGEQAWDWVAKNRTTEWGDLITVSGAIDPSKVKITSDGTEGVGSGPTNYDSGHKTIGNEINAELLSKLLRVQLGWADKAILANPPHQR